MRKVIALAAIAAGLTTTPAMAKGGFYVGALAGYQGLHVKAADGSAKASADSAVYGVDAGYDLSLGGAFVGIEGEASTSGGSTHFPNSFSGAYDGLKANAQYYVGARAGAPLMPRVAAYAKFGYTPLHNKAFTSAGSLRELKDNAGGVRFGGGLQAQIAGPIEAKIEYRHSRYNDVNSANHADATTNQVVAGLGVRF